MAKSKPERSGKTSGLSLLAIGVALFCFVYPQHAWTAYRNVNEQARLYLVRALMRRMGGQVRFHSAPGAGFEAELSFPASREEGAAG